MSDTAAEPAGPSADEPAAEPAAERIPLPQKLGYASGELVLPVYNIGLAVNPAPARLGDGHPAAARRHHGSADGDPLRQHPLAWGRRKPYVVAGAIACAALLPLLWLSPFKSDWAVFGWLTVFGCLYFLAYTVFIIPWQAMGFEMTGDCDERTRLLAWPNYMGSRRASSCRGSRR